MKRNAISEMLSFVSQCRRKSANLGCTTHVTDLTFMTDKLFWEAAASQPWLVKDTLQPYSRWSYLELRKCSGKSSLYSESRALAIQAANFGSSTNSLLDLQHIRRRTGIQEWSGAAFPSLGCPSLTRLVCLAIHQDLISSAQIKKAGGKKSPIKGPWVMKSKPQSQETLLTGFSLLTQCRGGSITLWTKILLDEALNNVFACSQPPHPARSLLPPCCCVERKDSAPAPHVEKPPHPTAWCSSGLLPQARGPAPRTRLCTPGCSTSTPGTGTCHASFWQVVALTSKQWNCI